MRELPEEDDQEQRPGLDAQPSRSPPPSRSPAAGRPGPRRRRVQGRPRLERRVDERRKARTSPAPRPPRAGWPRAAGSRTPSSAEHRAEDRGLDRRQPAGRQGRGSPSAASGRRARAPATGSSALAPPATRPVPSSVSEQRRRDAALPRAPSRKPTPTVTRTITTIRGLVSETYAESSRRRPRPARRRPDGSARTGSAERDRRFQATASRSPARTRCRAGGVGSTSDRRPRCRKAAR